MAIFEIASDNIRTIEETTFGAAGIRERADLQRLLRKQIEIISPDTLLVAEEFCECRSKGRSKGDASIFYHTANGLGT